MSRTVERIRQRQAEAEKRKAEENAENAKNALAALLAVVIVGCASRPKRKKWWQF